jgi:hypothetical protein
VRACLDALLARLPCDTWSGGPGVLTAVLPGRNDVLLLPPGTFYPVHYAAVNRNTTLVEGATWFPWTFAVHHYWGSWLEPARRRVPA